MQTDGDFRILQIGFVEAILVRKEWSAFSAKLLFVSGNRIQLWLTEQQQKLSRILEYFMEPRKQKTECGKDNRMLGPPERG